MDDMRIPLVYMWTRDAKVPVNEIWEYVLQSLPFRSTYVAYTDGERLEAVKKVLVEYDRQAGIYERGEAGKVEMPVIAEIVRERKQQDDKWGGPEHDDQHHVIGWMGLIGERLHYEGLDTQGARRNLIEIAALAIAAIESIDRQGKQE